MSVLEFILVFIGFGVAIIIWQLSSITPFLNKITYMLQSLDAEVFHLAQEQDPNYGLCDNCGCRGIVRNVIRKEQGENTTNDELFFCKACWWLSDSVEQSDENIYYKDRQTERDKLAARIGPS